ncbi:hypothetical protein PSTG_19281 [Puccinia striiformis f. sp. tritici PST-78]|uniref:DUF4054 domain-containing protein n=1 Tax=Puccinia striiformis f. sp. tritici PST-78 TaxID=1165861 RepID=A0A0L0UJR6_9BASI|nr:hypothetical protein PSTG_19281 [Puccinia striiformis f. sp. tritici PST-78]
MPKNSNLPTNDKFREDFPEFADKTRYPDTAVNFYLGQADTILNQDVLSDHNGSAGVATSKSVDKVSVSYDVSGVINPDAGFWNNTGYGREFFWWWSMFGAGGRQLL